MESLTTLFPDFAGDLVRKLRDDGYDHAALVAPNALVAKITWDDVANAGFVYIYPLRERVAKSFPLETTPFSIVEFDDSGYLFGIEFLSPPKAFADRLRGLAVV